MVDRKSRDYMLYTVERIQLKGGWKWKSFTRKLLCVPSNLRKHSSRIKIKELDIQASNFDLLNLLYFDPFDFE